MEKRQVHQVPAVPGYTPQTLALIECLRNGKVGEVKSNRELGELIGGRDVGCHGKGYHALQSAIRYVERHFSLVWRPQRDQKCIKCLDPSESISEGRNALQGIHRKASRAVRVLATVRSEDLPESERPTHNAMIAQCGMLLAMSGAQATKKIGATKINETPPNLERLLECFK